MNRHFNILLVALIPVTAMAQQVSPEAAEEIALDFGKARTGALRAASRDAGTVSLSYTAQTGTENDFYVFNYPDNRGFVIVSADSRTLQPVLAYSDQGSFDSGNIPSNAARVLASYQEQIGHLRASKAALRPAVADPVEQVVIVQPLIKTRWHQSQPYNGLCPIDPKNGQRSVTGCIATALAQVMNYWKWPEKGHGYHYNYNDTTLCVNYDESVYNWSTTLQEYDPGSDSSLIADIQKIMFDCGVATNMKYSAYGSSTFDNSAKKALITYFNYAPTIRLVTYDDVYNDYYFEDPDSVWISLLKEELNIGHPVIMSGQDYYNGGGHAFICDGYDNKNYFHFNFGWGGYLDAYFLPTAISLRDGSDYSNDQSIIIGIEPDRSGEWIDGYPIFNIQEDMAVLEDIIEPYDTLHVLEIPSSVKSGGINYPVVAINGYAFSTNPSISGVKIPTAVFQIMEYAFYGCPNLVEVEIPNSVAFYDWGAFGGCDNLSKLTVARGNPYYYSPNNSNAIIDTYEDRLVQGCNYTRIPSNVRIIGENSFEGFSRIETIVLPESVTDIESEAFYNCAGLKAVTLDENVEAIGRDAFSECPLLTDVYCLGTVPPQIQDNSFPAGITVHVITGTAETWTSDAFWSAFRIVDDIFDPTYVTPLKAGHEEEHYWDIQGRSADKATHGLRISNGRKYYLR